MEGEGGAINSKSYIENTWAKMFRTANKYSMVYRKCNLDKKWRRHLVTQMSDAGENTDFPLHFWETMRNFLDNPLLSARHSNSVVECVLLYAQRGAMGEVWSVGWEGGGVGRHCHRLPRPASHHHAESGVDLFSSPLDT